MKPHWYRMFIGWCPVCSRDHGYRVRVYGIKPAYKAGLRAAPDVTHVWLPDTYTYDGCEL